MNNELMIQSKEIQRMNSQQLKKIAEEKSKFILAKINESAENVREARELATNVKNGDYGFLGKNGKKINDLAEAQSLLTDAVENQNQLIYQCVQLVQVNGDFARVMSQYLSQFMRTGFQNYEGKFVRLDSDVAEQANFILESAENFASNQKKVEDSMMKLHSKFSILDNNQKQQNEKFQEHDQKFLEKDELDEEQSHNISVLKATLNRLKENELSHITDLNSKIFNVDEKIKKLQTSFDSHIEVERKTEEIESKIRTSVKNLPPDFKEDFSNLFYKYTQENKTSIQEIDEKLNDFKIKAVNQISEIKSGLRKSLSDLDSKFREIKPASKFPLVAGIIAIVLGVGAFVSVFLPLKVYIEQENAVINTRLTNYIKDNNESLKNELNGKFDSITGNSNENQISLLSNQLNELKAYYQKSIEENKAILSESEAKITALSEKIEEQNKEIFSLNEKISAYEKNAKDESVKLGQQIENLNSETNADAEQSKLPEPESSSIQLENTAASQIENQAGENENLIPENSGAETENTGDLLESQSNENNNSEIQVSDKSDYDSKNENLDSSKNIEKTKPNLFLRILKIVGIVVGSIILLGIILIIIGTKLG